MDSPFLTKAYLLLSGNLVFENSRLLTAQPEMKAASYHPHLNLTWSSVWNRGNGFRIGQNSPLESHCMCLKPTNLNSCVIISRLANFPRWPPRPAGQSLSFTALPTLSTELPYDATDFHQTSAHFTHSGATSLQVTTSDLLSGPNTLREFLFFFFKSF